MNYTLFKACRQFYKVYPQIGSTVSSKFKLPDFGKSSTVLNEFVTDPDVLVNNLSFSHIREIMVDIPLILGNLITIIFDYQILRKPLKTLSL